jgi:hypothetical protein
MESANEGIYDARLLQSMRRVLRLSVAPLASAYRFPYPAHHVVVVIWHAGQLRCSGRKAGAERP